jgi:hypothetical protein
MQVNLTWSLYQEETIQTIERHCSTCGRTTTFTDTGKKRHNANGKNIFEYIIYRCEKGHSWNYKIRQYKASESNRHAFPGKNGHSGNRNWFHPKIQPLSLSQYHTQGITLITIQLDAVEGAWRLDKLLSAYITDVSRTEIQNMIRTRRILLNHKEVKSGTVLKRGSTIQVHL